jgi:uncharacterized membrane protein
LDTLFGKRDAVTLDKTNARRVQKAIDIEKNKYAGESQGYFQLSGWDIFIGIAISFLFFIMVIFIIDEDAQYMYFLALMTYLPINILFGTLLRGYTKKGLAIKKEIEGFKMFLATTEQERLKIIGTPPTKTPELYEKYLPYAITLGVEQQWSQQFAPLFEEMREAGHPYVFVWFSGRDLDAFTAASFASNLSNSISSSIISAAPTPPGSSSGSGGRGSSGGGGGGGGGGGW